MGGTKTTDQAVALKPNKTTMKTVAVEAATAKKRASLSRKAKATFKNYIEESDEEVDEDIEVDEDEAEDFEVVEVVDVEKKPIFATFKTEEKLDEGLCVIRSLGDGTYELVNLNYTPRVDIATEETGEIIKATPGRREMLVVTAQQWEDAKLKAELAVKSADGQLFRFLKLPVELRYKIYEDVLVAKAIRRVPGRKTYEGLGLLLSCRQIYDECLQFLYRNTFRLLAKDLDVLFKNNSIFRTRIQDLSFCWSGWIKDNAAFRLMAKLPHLKILRLSYTYYTVTIFEYQNRNKLYQDDVTIKPFSRGNAFDSLVLLRGLEKVTVEKSWGASIDNKAFEKFLMRVITAKKEAPAPQTKATKSRKQWAR